MRSHSFLLTLLSAVFLLVACSPATDLEGLVPFTPATKGYTLQIPETWQATEEPESGTVHFTPKGSKTDPGTLKVSLLFTPVDGQDNDARLQAIKEAFEPFLSASIDESYTVVNQGETTVGKMNALIIDSGKPWQGTYLTAREVLVNSTQYAIAFLGSGEEKAWQAFLPRFRAMLESFQLDAPEPTPLPGGYKP